MSDVQLLNLLKDAIAETLFKRFSASEPEAVKISKALCDAIDLAISRAKDEGA